LIDVNADVNFLDSVTGVQPDYRSLPYGVTTIADPDATKEVVRRSRTRVLPLPARVPTAGLIASGMNRENVLSRQASMTRTLSLHLNRAEPFTELIEGATVRAAKAIGREDLGVLKAGAEADIALFSIEQGEFPLADEDGRRLAAKARVICVMTIRKGDVVWDLHGLSIREWTQSGRYTSYR
jgi:predicted amidohydrolase